MEDPPIRIEPILEGRNELMIKRIRESLALKRMALLTLFAIIPLVIVCLSILQIYPEDLRRSFTGVGGITLILGIPFSFFLTRKSNLPYKPPSNKKEQEPVQGNRELETVYELGTLINQ